MKKSFQAVVLSALLVVSSSPAATMSSGKTLILRGGWGFLFPDHNSFVNPGQFAVSHGMAFEANYFREQNGSSQAITPSLVYGGNHFGLGAYATRAGGDLLRDGGSSDSAGIGLGFSFAKERLTLGLGYDRSVRPSPTNDGAVKATLTLNPPQRRGVSLGFGMSTVLNRGGGSTQSGVFGVGYQFNTHASLEANLELVNLSTLNDWGVGSFFNIGSQEVYLSVGHRYQHLATTHHGVVRLGFILGSSVDLSGYASAPLVQGAELGYGVTLRAMF